MGQILEPESKEQKIPVVLQNHAPTPEPQDPEEAARWREEKEREAGERRALLAAAAEQRALAQQKRRGGGSSKTSTGAKKGETALEQASRENRGWRDVDEQADLRAWN